MRYASKGLVYGSLAMAAGGTLGAQGLVKPNEEGLRRAATHAPMPPYPAGSIRRPSSGVVVAELATGADGVVTRVDILEAPDPDIAQSVRATLQQWKFTPAQVMGRSQPSGLEGKLVFYFRVAGGRGSVVNPDDMPENAEVVAKRRAARAAREARRAASPSSGPPPAPPAVQGGHANEFPEVSEVQLRQLASQGPVTFLDIRERPEFKAGHRAGARNIPADELNSRARVELPLDKHVAVDCSQQSTTWCHVAGALLRELGFTRVVIFIP